MNNLKSHLLVLLAACAAGLGCSAGCHDPQWMSGGAAIQGNNGASYQTALRVAGRQYTQEAWTKADEEWLRREEDGWMYLKYGKGLSISLVPEEFNRLLHHTTETQHGRVARVYDIVTLTVPGKLTNTTYFHVTRARYVRPRN
ncbi:MAG: hypothetical protein JWQ71_2183 [Pedosphaera sp.]|nr:hypothetical protein [Pedosphaera sp.]